MNYVLVNHEKHDLCDSYIVEFIHDATGNYYERGKYGNRNFHITKTPIFLLEVLKLLLFYLPVIATLCFFDLFLYKIPMHRKWVILAFHIREHLLKLCEHLLKLSSLS